MKKTAFALVAVLTFVALPVGAQTLSKDDIIIELLQQLVQINQVLSANVMALNTQVTNLQARVATLESQKEGVKSTVVDNTVGSPGYSIPSLPEVSPDDFQKAAELRSNIDDPAGVCKKQAERRTWDRIFHVMCLVAKQ